MDIIKTTAKVFDFNPYDITCKSRKWRSVAARQIIAFISYEFGYDIITISGLINRHRTDIYNCLNQAIVRIEYDELFKEFYKSVLTKLISKDYEFK